MSRRGVCAGRLELDQKLLENQLGIAVPTEIGPELLEQRKSLEETLKRYAVSQWGEF